MANTLTSWTVADRRAAIEMIFRGAPGDEIDALIDAFILAQGGGVQPGDLITAQLVNRLLQDVLELQVRVALLEKKKPPEEPRPDEPKPHRPDAELDVKVARVRVTDKRAAFPFVLRLRSSRAQTLRIDFEFDGVTNAVAARLREATKVSREGGTGPDVDPFEMGSTVKLEESENEFVAETTLADRLDVAVRKLLERGAVRLVVAGVSDPSLDFRSQPLKPE